MPNRNPEAIALDHAHCRAICDEIGERLREVLKPEALEIPQRLRELLDRLYGAMGQPKGWCRTQPAWREQQSLGLRDRIEARAAGKFGDVELERQAHVAYWQQADVAFRLGDVRLWKTSGNGGGAALKGANIYRLSGKFRHLGRQTACAPSRAEE